MRDRLRKVVGAKRRHVMFQLLCEARILSILGGIIGLGLSFVAVGAYGLATGSSAGVIRGVGFTAIAFCAAIGVAPGDYPAAKA